MKIGAYQFAVTNNITKNLNMIESAIAQAAYKDTKLLVFPECALTGYPVRDIESSSQVDFTALNIAFEEIQHLATENNMHIIVGAIVNESGSYYNAAVVFSPHKKKEFYYKRALWGWDQDNFQAGNAVGIFEIDSLKIGIRICFEVRFPKLFRELYLQQTDLNLILFYDLRISKRSFGEQGIEQIADFLLHKNIVI